MDFGHVVSHTHSSGVKGQSQLQSRMKAVCTPLLSRSGLIGCQQAPKQSPDFRHCGGGLGAFLEPLSVSHETWFFSLAMTH